MAYGRLKKSLRAGQVAYYIWWSPRLPSRLVTALMICDCVKLYCARRINGGRRYIIKWVHGNRLLSTVIRGCNVLSPVLSSPVTFQKTICNTMSAPNHGIQHLFFRALYFDWSHSQSIISKYTKLGVMAASRNCFRWAFFQIPEVQKTLFICSKCDFQELLIYCLYLFIYVMCFICIFTSYASFFLSSLSF